MIWFEAYILVGIHCHSAAHLLAEEVQEGLELGGCKLVALDIDATIAE
jgi:hypothetical protein